MKKSDLELGMVVKTQNGQRFLIAEFRGKRHLIGEEDSISMEEYAEDMSYPIPDYDIIEVYEQCGRPVADIFNMLGELIWKRTGEIKEITAAEAFRALKEHYGCSVRIMEECL